MSAWRWLAIAAVALSLSAVGGVLSAHREHLATLPLLSQEIPPPPGTRFLPLGEGLEVDGVHREMAYAQSPDTAEWVADRYEGIWHSQGLQVQRKRLIIEGDKVEEWVVAGASDDAYVRSIVAVNDEVGSTVVASLRQALPQRATFSLPKPDTCTVVSQTAAQDDGRRTVLALLNCVGSTEELVSFFDQRFAGRRRALPWNGDASVNGMHVAYAGTGFEATLTVAESPQETDDENSASNSPRAAVSLFWAER